MHVIALQTEIAWQDKPVNHRAVEAMLAETDVPPGSLVVLPELFSVGYSMNIETIAEGADRPSERFLAELAERHACFVLGGVAHRNEDGTGRNEAVVFDPAGAEAARYQKRRLLPVSGEADRYTPGGRAVTFDWHGATVAPLVCYDLRFPELFREAAAQGAELLAVIANFPEARHEHWRALLIARAIENQAYVVGVNRCGSDPNQRYAGGSMIVGPRGELMREAGPEPTALHGDLDFEALRAYRREFPALGQMR